MMLLLLHPSPVHVTVDVQAETFTSVALNHMVLADVAVGIECKTICLKPTQVLGYQQPANLTPRIRWY